MPESRRRLQYCPSDLTTIVHLSRKNERRRGRRKEVRRFLRGNASAVDQHAQPSPRQSRCSWGLGEPCPGADVGSRRGTGLSRGGHVVGQARTSGSSFLGSGPAANEVCTAIGADSAVCPAAGIDVPCVVVVAPCGTCWTAEDCTTWTAACAGADSGGLCGAEVI
jgi:hypothetical protein